MRVAPQSPSGEPVHLLPHATHRVLPTLGTVRTGGSLLVGGRSGSAVCLVQVPPWGY